ncbi:alcohol dehydrogenase [Trichoderma arundinaceum]|uniref:Alcohol dehydrogenase n=1 Tax=Trichoderma arundinaceum TaxID=490622 RepID=A0A395NVX5_TRIAR|nr:alcohol dehydrogenase [Trichoderma arundinaceum]
MASIPTVQSAAVIENAGPNGIVRIEDSHPVETPGKNEVLVKLAFSGICGSEVRAMLGWGNYKPVIGHEGVGIVVKVGENVADSILGQRVGVKWLHSACSLCSQCKSGFSNHCIKPVFTGLHVQGTLQQYVIADSRYLTRIPDGLPGELAAPLLCAGLTMAGGIAKLDTHIPSDGWVVVSGSGGGLGHIGVQIASRLRGFKVIAVDSGSSKRELSLQCGAQAFIDFSTENVEERVKEITGEGAHACLIVSGSEAAFELAPKLVRNAGLLVIIGLPPATYNFPMTASLYAVKALTVTGVMVGNEQQMEELLQQAAAGVISPAVQVEEFSETPHIFEKLKNNQVTGRIVHKMPSPIMTATLQAAALSTASNFCAQFIETYWNNSIFHLDLIQLIRFIVYTLITAPPNYLWQQFLEKSLPAYPLLQQPNDPGGKDIELKAMEEAAAGPAIGEGSKSQSQGAAQSKFSIRNTLAKWFIDCITAGAIMNTLAFLIVMGILKGQPAVQISSNIKTVSIQYLSPSPNWQKCRLTFVPIKETIPIIIAGYKIWPIASIISFSFIPVHRRIVFLSFIGLLWGIYMSLVAARV